jgi:hypothetical protein
MSKNLLKIQLDINELLELACFTGVVANKLLTQEITLHPKVEVNVMYANALHEINDHVSFILFEHCPMATITQKQILQKNEVCFNPSQIFAFRMAANGAAMNIYSLTINKVLQLVSVPPITKESLKTIAHGSNGNTNESK